MKRVVVRLPMQAKIAEFLACADARVDYLGGRAIRIVAWRGPDRTVRGSLEIELPEGDLENEPTSPTESTGEIEPCLK